MLHNRAWVLELEVPSVSESDSDPDSPSEDTDGVAEQPLYVNNPISERARVTVGKAARERVINNFFWG